MREVRLRAVRARAAAPPRGDRRSNYDVVQRHRQTTLGCASLTAVVFFIRVTNRAAAQRGAAAAFNSQRCALHGSWRRALRGAAARGCVCGRAQGGGVRTEAPTHRRCPAARSRLVARSLVFQSLQQPCSPCGAAPFAATAASPDLEDAKPPPPPRPRRRRLRARLLAPAQLAALAVVVGADGPTSSILLLFAAPPRRGRRNFGRALLSCESSRRRCSVHGGRRPPRVRRRQPSPHSPLSGIIAGWSAFALPRPGAGEPEPRAGDDAARRTLGLLRGADGEAVGGARRARVARRRARGRAGSGLCTS